jgi:hypothetical protein
LYAAAAVSLIGELRSRFPQHEILDAHGIVYPQYWAAPNAEERFRKHLHLLKRFYGESKTIVEGDKSRSIAPLLDSWQLDSQQAYFKLAMLNNHKQAMEQPFDVNPLTRLWRSLDSASLCIFPKYMKLAKMVVVHVLGSVQDERCFSSLSFLKNKLRNALDEHLELVVGMYSQKIFSLESFPYDTCFDRWANSGERYRYAVSH